MACAAQLHEIAAKGWRMYLDAHNGRFLQGPNANVNYGGRQGATSAHRGPKPLNRYLQLEEVFAFGGEVFRCSKDSGDGTAPIPNFDQLTLGAN